MLERAVLCIVSLRERTGPKKTRAQVNRQRKPKLGVSLTMPQLRDSTSPVGSHSLQIIIFLHCV